MSLTTGEELQEYFVEYKKEIYAFLCRRVESEALARDMLSETFTQFEQLARFQEVPSPRIALYRIANKLALGYLRDQMKNAKSDLATSAEELMACFEEYRTEIYRFLCRRLGCEDTAEDLVQDTYLRLVDYREGQHISNPRAFIYKIANNLALDHLRAQKRRDFIVEIEALSESVPLTVEDHVDPQSVVMNQQQLEILNKLIQGFPPVMQDVFIRSRFYGQTHEQIADALGISKSWVEKNIMQALAECRIALSRHDINKQ